MPGPNDGFLVRAQLYLVRASLVYLAILGLLTIPVVQRHAVYLHKVRLPLSADFDDPSKYGLPVHRSVNVKIDTPDNERLGGWLILPKSPINTNATLLPTNTPSDSDIRSSLSTHPTILYFHGNAATRAMSCRVRYYTTYARAYGANVLAIDYRGFADSTGTPSKEGLVIDARAALDWVVERGAKAEEVLIVGLSLGTGVVSALGAELAREGIHPKGIVLFAPFTSIRSVLLDYQAFGILPVLQPLQMFPFLTKFVAGFFSRHFDTQAVIRDIEAPLLIVHSRNDRDIPYTHSHRLFEHLLDELLPSIPILPKTPQEIQKVDWNAHNDAIAKRRAAREAIVKTQTVDNFGTISRFTKSDGREVVFVEALWGGHNLIGLQESVVDLIGSLFGYQSRD